MKVLYFDCFSGISGDMTAGALLDLGIDKKQFLAEFAKLKLKGLKLNIKKQNKNGISGTDFEVIAPASHGRSHGHARTPADIEKLLSKSRISKKAAVLAIKIFREIGRAEAKVHGKNINEIHFHEVGGLDSIADITSAAICLDLLGVEKVFSSEIHDGKGFIKCAHGMLPVPVPAVMEMLKSSGIPFVQEEINTELVTPTGMGIIKSISSGYGKMPAMKITGTGWGFGKRDTGRLNALRVVAGELTDAMPAGEDIIVLETNIDNMTPEMLGFAMEAIFSAGAVDVFFTSIYMKKNRPAVLLTALAAVNSEKAVVEAILKHTTTLGVRRHAGMRYCMDRKIKNVKTKYGLIRVKFAKLGNIEKFSPEFEDCRAAALKYGIAPGTVYEAARRAAGEKA